MSELTKGKGKDFDLNKTWEFRLGEYAMAERNFTVFVNNIGFDNRKITSFVSLPVKREPAPLGSDVIDVTAKVDLNAAGTPVSPYIYGVSHGDAEALHEMGVAMRRRAATSRACTTGAPASPPPEPTGSSRTARRWRRRTRRKTGGWSCTARTRSTA